MQRDSITEQHNFLSTLAKGLPPGSYFQVAEKQPNGGWHNSAWHEQPLVGPWYFFTGSCNNGRKRRQQDWTAVRAIVLDDVTADGVGKGGGKIVAPPTWKLETSEGNFQWGYLLKTWDADIPKADALFDALVKSGLQDKGVNNACRLFRIPGSINDKPGRDDFASVLHEVDWTRTYTLNTLAKALKVKPGAPILRRTPTGERPGAGKDDALFEWLGERGMVREETGDGWWEVECPFASEHTDGRDEVRYLPSFSSETGAAKVWCWHAHGEDKATYTERFMAWVKAEGGPTPDAAKEERRRKFAEYAKRQQAAAAPPPPQREPGEEYDDITLAHAIGPIDRTVLPFPDKTAAVDKVTGMKVLAKLQPCTSANVLAALRHVGIQPRLNLMNATTSFILPERIDPAGFGGKTVYEIDRMVSRVLQTVFTAAGMSNKKDLADSIAGLADSNYWHPAKEWIEAKPWDGQDRMEELLATVKTPTPDLFAMYFRRWALQAVEAVCGWVERREGQKALCLVLAGKQGVGKTRWLKALAPAFSAVGKHLSLDSFNARDSKHEALQGMVVELGELDTTFKKSANGSLKAFISDSTDEYRLPYANVWLKRPRCTSFCASVNDDQFLQDATGSRRFGVVWVDHCNADHKIDMQQLFAQVHAEWSQWKEGSPVGQWWLDDEEEVLQIDSNEKHQSVDGIVETVIEEYRKRQDREVYPKAYGLNASSIAKVLGFDASDPSETKRIGIGMRQVTGKKGVNMKPNGSMNAWLFWLTENEAKNILKVKPMPSVKA